MVNNIVEYSCLDSIRDMILKKKKKILSVTVAQSCLSLCSLLFLMPSGRIERRTKMTLSILFFFFFGHAEKDVSTLKNGVTFGVTKLLTSPSEHLHLKIASYFILLSPKTILSIITYHFIIFSTFQLLFYNTTH